MEADIRRRRLMQLIAGAGTVITLTQPVGADSSERERPATIRAMPDRHGPMRTGRFEVQIDDVEVAGWQSVTIPSSSTEQGEYREEGKRSETEQLVFPGGDDLPDLAMERGVKPGDDRIFEWRRDVIRGGDEGRKEITVILTDEKGEPVMRWRFREARVKDYDPPELDASADGDVATESITVAYDRMVREEV